MGSVLISLVINRPPDGTPEANIWDNKLWLAAVTIFINDASGDPGDVADNFGDMNQPNIAACLTELIGANKHREFVDYVENSNRQVWVFRRQMSDADADRLGMRRGSGEWAFYDGPDPASSPGGAFTSLADGLAEYTGYVVNWRGDDDGSKSP